MTAVLSLFDEHKLQERAYALAERFVDTGALPANIADYHTIYTQLLELVRGAARSVGRKKFGYMRSRALTSAGRLLLAHKMLLDCRTRRSPPSPALLRLCEDLDLDPSRLLTLSYSELRRLVQTHRSKLWDTLLDKEQVFILDNE